MEGVQNINEAGASSVWCNKHLRASRTATPAVALRWLVGGQDCSSELTIKWKENGKLQLLATGSFAYSNTPIST